VHEQLRVRTAEPSSNTLVLCLFCFACAAVLLQVDDLRGSPLTVGSLEEIIDEK
jgi:hypothetical protein